jgi:carbon monoxide dehydrogenase subunit G
MRIAMVTVETSVCIDAPVNEVWALLARLEDIRLWSEAVTDAICDGPITEGVGARRTCLLRGGVTISERWVQWDEGHSFTYEGMGIPGVVSARNSWSVAPVGSRTQLRSRAEVQLKGGRLGRLLERLVSRQIRRVGTQTLAR